MNYYIRKISRSKWPQEIDGGGLNIDEVQADAITGCTKTSSNRLSLWRVDKKPDNKNIRDVWPIIASFEKPNRCDIIYISEEDISNSGISLEPSPNDARTALSELVNTHYNAVVQDYKGLGQFADIIIKSLKTHVRFQEKEVSRELLDMISKDVIHKEDLAETMINKLNIS